MRFIDLPLQLFPDPVHLRSASENSVFCYDCYLVSTCIERSSEIPKLWSSQLRSGFGFYVCLSCLLSRIGLIIGWNSQCQCISKGWKLTSRFESSIILPFSCLLLVLIVVSIISTLRERIVDSCRDSL